ncbi:MAG: helix-turn-helix domain-containing protein [Planctomycetes bacterium]|nr:helix-turn-helix domain-containing protein [Planctomycetota bacterium]MBL7044642.1 helix-turn-helix domain-containing protein [Pirellulaceae bacterium]
MNLKQLGLRIKTQRERRKLRQSDIAGALQISAQAVSKWERGENAPDISVLVDLARLLGVSVEWLLGGNSAERDTFPATVFCTSLNGFAQQSAVMPPRDVAAWANGIYYTLTEAMMRQDGVPIKYVGDGSLGFFAGNDHADRALRAARESRRLLDAEDLVITLHSGDVYLGTVGHPDYARPDIIGQTVNTAFLVMPWIAEHCPTGIGITDAARGLLHDSAGLVDRGEVTVRGVQVPITIFEPESE